MAGYFRQLVDRVLDPLPGLRPLVMAPGAQAREPDIEEVLTPFRHVADSSGIAVGNVADPAPDRASRDALPAPSASAVEAIGGQVDEGPRTGQGMRRTAMRPQIADESPPPPAFRGFPSPPPTHTRKHAPLIAREVPPEPTEPTTTVAPRRPVMKPRPSQSRAPVDTLRPVPLRTTPQRDRQPQAADAQAAPEVHIHIGRIELTAVAPSRPARRESAVTRKPMSLDDYLQQRNRKMP